jgi:hypothetical protein
MMVGWIRMSGLSLVLGCGPQVVFPSEDGSDDGGSGSSGDRPDAPPSSGSSSPPSSTAGPTPGSSTVGPDDPGDDEGSSSSGVATMTGTPSTAGDGGGEPGGAGPGATPDADGDVMLPGADALAAAVYTDGALMDFRVQLAAPPFDVEATYDITWCIDTGAGGSGSCATHADGIDAYLVVGLDGPGELVSATPGVDVCLHGAFEPETNTLRLLVPVDTFPGTTDLRWILTINYGGSFGNSEWIPEMGDLEVVWLDDLPPFSGDPTC